MQVHFIHTPIESYVHHISLTRFGVAGKKILQPDGCWDLTVLRRSNGTRIMRIYQATKAVVIEHEPGDEILAISFKPGVFIPFLPRDARHDKGVGLFFFGPQNFMLGYDRFEIPSPENALGLVQKLIQRGVLHMRTDVMAVLDGHPPEVSDRTLQRAFLQSTGLTYKYLAQIKRAQKAVALLQTGISAAQVAGDLGYTDQAHMTHSLKYIMGQTPHQIYRATDDITPWKSSSFYELLVTSPESESRLLK
ncbi:MAG TPA: helix-turn-helix domain-containing protein [Magnetospirillaceae bacterium]|nr:helix-turn-helix domain-containing protein [Magnetospirillaceae bacterium]